MIKIAKVKIGLDAGHGLKTAGKQTPDGIKEWTLNDKVRDKVVNILSSYDCEIIHTDNNEGNVDECLSDRVAKYKKAGVAVFVSIHHNALNGKWGNHTGVEVFVDKNPTKKDMKLAQCIYSRLVRKTGLKGRGIKEYNFWVINQDTIPAVLVEGGFIDSKIDYKLITTDEGQTAYAQAVAEGLIEFLNLKKTTKKTTKTKNCFKKYTGNSRSIVDALKSVGVSSSYSFRKKIAKSNGINAYVGTPKQNVKMLELLRKGKLIKPD